MIYIYTEDFFWLPRVKKAVKKILGRHGGGPEAVLASLRRGLTQLGVKYVLNKTIPNGIDTACVLNGPDTLAWAVAQKQKGKIKKIIAGPNIVVTPLDFNSLILSPYIDRYVVPAQWSVDWWSSLTPKLKPKLALWPAGVHDTGEHRDPDGPILVFKKITSGMPKALQEETQSLWEHIQTILTKNNFAFRTVNYSVNLGQGDFFKKMSSSKFMIYLSTNESQGLALHEAWMANLPTLVWNRQKLEYGGFVWQDSKLSAPYMTDQAGMFFLGQSDFETRLGEFIKNYQNFTPRDYSLKNFTDKISAQKYLDLINSL